MSEAVQQTTDSEDASEDLGDQLFDVKLHTLEDDRIRGRITDVEDDGEQIRVEFTILTTGEHAHVNYSKPKTWSTMHPFVRLVEWCGYSAASVDQLVGDEVPLTQTGDDSPWNTDGLEIDIERLPGESILDQSDYYYGVMKGITATIAFLIWPIGASIMTGSLSITTQISLPQVLTVGILTIIGTIIASSYVRRTAEDDRRVLNAAESTNEQPKAKKLRGEA